GSGGSRRIRVRSRPRSTACHEARVRLRRARNSARRFMPCCLQMKSRTRAMTDAVLRPEIYREPMSQETFGIVQKPLTLFERLYNQNWLRKLFVLIVIAVCWEVYARWLDNELLVPTFSATVRALVNGIASGVILTRALLSIKVLLMGFVTGVS